MLTVLLKLIFIFLNVHFIADVTIFEKMSYCFFRIILPTLLVTLNISENILKH